MPPHESAPQFDHVPVLLDEVVGLLDPQPGETLLDCTAGLGGHASAIANLVGPAGRVVLVDLDPANLARAEAAVRAALNPEDPAAAHVHAARGNFAAAPRAIRALGFCADMVLADLGFASTQVDDPARGLSFRTDGPLDMRLDPDGPLTAEMLVNHASQQELARILRDFGEERHAVRIARKVVAARAHSPISTTIQLAEIVRSACPPTRGPQRIDPATRTFQALRIAVNDELGRLETLLGAIEREAVRLAGGVHAGQVATEQAGWLNPRARVAVIAFHSLEDRPVKQATRDLVARDLADALTRKPVVAGEDERERNPRARSAKLRAVHLGHAIPAHAERRDGG